MASLISLFFPPFIVWSETIKKFYEAIILVFIFNMMVVYMGGYSKVLEYMSRGYEESFFGLFTYKTNTFMAYFTFFGIYQLLLANIIVSITSIICFYFGYYNKVFRFNDSFIYLRVYLIVSTVLCLTCLLFSYHLWKKHLEKFGILTKFLLIKLFIIFMLIQNVFISILTFTNSLATVKRSFIGNETGDLLEAAFTIFQLVPFSLAFSYYYSPTQVFGEIEHHEKGYELVENI